MRTTQPEGTTPRRGRTWPNLLAAALLASLALASLPPAEAAGVPPAVTAAPAPTQPAVHPAQPPPGLDGLVPPAGPPTAAMAAGPGPMAGPGGSFTPVYGPATVLADVYAAGVGLRATGSGSITVPGATGATVLAYVYWVLQEPAASPGASTITFAGTPVAGTLLGSGADLCWGSGASWGYRADVTALVAGPGPYAVSVLSGGGTLAEGASLVIVATTPTANEIVIVDGYDSIAGASTTVTIPRTATPALAPGTSELITIGADGQTQGPESMDWNGALLAANSWDGSDPETTPSGWGALWDTDPFAVTTVPGANTLDIHGTGDCLGPEAFTLSTPVGDGKPCAMTGRAYVAHVRVEDVGNTGYVGPTDIWSEDTGEVWTTASEHHWAGLASVTGPAIEGDVVASSVETFAQPECRSEARSGVAHLEDGWNPPPGIAPFMLRAAEAWSTSDCKSGSHGGTTIAYLMVAGVVLVDVTNVPPPNTALAVGPITVILNEHIAGPGVLEVTAVHVIWPGVLDAKLLSARSDIHDCTPPDPPEDPCPPVPVDTDAIGTSAASPVAPVAIDPCICELLRSLDLPCDPCQPVAVNNLVVVPTVCDPCEVVRPCDPCPVRLEPIEVGDGGPTPIRVDPGDIVAQPVDPVDCDPCRYIQPCDVCDLRAVRIDAAAASVALPAACDPCRYVHPCEVCRVDARDLEASVLRCIDEACDAIVRLVLPNADCVIGPIGPIDPIDPPACTLQDVAACVDAWCDAAVDALPGGQPVACSIAEAHVPDVAAGPRTPRPWDGDPWLTPAPARA